MGQLNSLNLLSNVKVDIIFPLKLSDSSALLLAVLVGLAGERKNLPIGMKNFLVI